MTIVQKTYGRRCGRKLRSSKQELMETLLPKIQITLGESLNLENYTQKAERRSVYKGCFLEIGFGAGEHLALQAAAHPDILMIGCEPFVNGVANLLELIEKENLSNIRIYPNNALHLLESLPDNFLDHIFLLFPDPWPKKGHHKRRFVQKETLTLLAQKLSPQGKLLIATDHADYFEWILERASAHEDLVFLNPDPKTWAVFPELWTQTRFQGKAIRAGRESRFLWFKKG
jgi:tRNA (guanine-N7-)-methyltransferase